MLYIVIAYIPSTTHSHLSAGGSRGAAGGAAADHPPSLARLLLPLLGAALRVRGQRVEEEDAGDEPVHDGGQRQGQHVEHGEIREVNRQVVTPGDFVAAAEQHHVVVRQLFDVRQEEPQDAVGGGERPHQQDDLLCPG